MFNFLKKSKTPDKYDDVDWHETEDNPDGKATHIALMFTWLASRGHITDEESREMREALDSRDETPSEILNRYADGKILSSMIDPVVVDFLNEFYDTRFFSAVENDDEVQLDRTHGRTPYNISDSWENADKISDWLDKQYAEWTSSRAK